MDKEILRIAQLIAEEEDESLPVDSMDEFDGVSTDEVESAVDDSMESESDLDKFMEVCDLLREHGIEISEFFDLCLEKLKGGALESPDGEDDFDTEDDELIVGDEKEFAPPQSES